MKSARVTPTPTPTPQPAMRFVRNTIRPADSAASIAVASGMEDQLAAVVFEFARDRTLRMFAGDAKLPTVGNVVALITGHDTAEPIVAINAVNAGHYKKVQRFVLRHHDNLRNAGLPSGILAYA